MAFAETSADEQKKQPYKYNGKELDQKLGLNTYDYSARYFDPALPRFTTVDPMAEKYYSISPYAYVGNNPVNAIDINGDSITPQHVKGFLQGALSAGTGLGGLIGQLQTTIRAIQGAFQADIIAQGVTTLAADPSGVMGAIGESKMNELSTNEELQGQIVGVAAVGLFDIAGGIAASSSKVGNTIGKTVQTTNEITTKVTTVGRWMSKTEYMGMNNGSPAAVGAGGKTSVTVGGPNIWSSAKPGSVYVEFQVPSNSLVSGGGTGIYSILGPNASKSQLFMLQKLGGQVSPPVQNISPILQIK